MSRFRADCQSFREVFQCSNVIFYNSLSDGSVHKGWLILVIKLYGSVIVCQSLCDKNYINYVTCHLSRIGWEMYQNFVRNMKIAEFIWKRSYMNTSSWTGKTITVICQKGTYLVTARWSDMPLYVMDMKFSWYWNTLPFLNIDVHIGTIAESLHTCLNCLFLK